MSQKYILNILMEDEFGILTRITNLFTRRGFQLDSLAIGPSEYRGIIRATISISGDESTCNQLTKQLYKIINVIAVQDLTNTSFVERELALLKIQLNDSTRAPITQLVTAFKAKILDISHSTLTLEITGNNIKILAAKRLFAKFGLCELASTGRICLTRDL